MYVGGSALGLVDPNGNLASSSSLSAPVQYTPTNGVVTPSAQSLNSTAGNTDTVYAGIPNETDTWSSTGISIVAQKATYVVVKPQNGVFVDSSSTPNEVPFTVAVEDQNHTAMAPSTYEATVSGLVRPLRMEPEASPVLILKNRKLVRMS